MLAPALGTLRQLLKLYRGQENGKQLFEVYLMQNIAPYQVTLRLGFLANLQVSSSPFSQSLFVHGRTVTATRIITPSDESRFPGQLFGNKAILDGSSKILLVAGLDNSSQRLNGELGLLLKLWDHIQAGLQTYSKHCRVTIRCWQGREGAIHGGHPEEQWGEQIQVTSRQQMLLFLSQQNGVNRQDCSLAVEITIMQVTSLKQSSILLAEPSRTLLYRPQFDYFLRELTNKEQYYSQNNSNNSSEPLLNMIRSASAGTKEPLHLIFQVEQEETLSNNPIITLVQNLSQRVSQHLLAQQLSQQIAKQQAILNRLRQKHKTVLGVLSKCMGVECGQLERRPQLGLDSFGSGPRDKFRLATQKRQQNEDMLQSIDRNLSQQELELSSIRYQHSTNYQRLQQQKKKLKQQQQRIIAELHQLTNPELRADPEPVTTSIYSRPKHKLKPRADDEQNNNPSSSFISGHLPTHKSLKLRHDKKDMLLLQTLNKQDSSIHSPTQGSKNLMLSIRKQQTLSEIEKLMRLVIKQEQVIQGCLSRRGSQLSAGLKRQLKSSCLEIKIGRLGELLMMGREEGRFQEWMKAQQGFQEWMLWMLRRQQNQGCGTVTTIRDI